MINANAFCAGWVNYAVDGAALVLIVLFSVRAAKKGFVECLFGFLSTLIAIVIALFLTKSVVGWTGGLFGLQEIIGNGATGALSGVNGFDIDISSAGIQTALEDKNLPQFLINIVLQNFGNSDVPEGTTLAMVVGETVGSLAVTLIAWLALFLLTKLVLRILRKILTSIINRIPLVGFVNGILGFVVGVLQGVLIVSAVIAVVALIPAEGLTTFFNECMFVKVLFNHNPINVVLGWIIG